MDKSISDSMTSKSSYPTTCLEFFAQTPECLFSESTNSALLISEALENPRKAKLAQR